MKTQYTKHLILGGLINGQLYGPNTFTEIAEMDDLQAGKSLQKVASFVKVDCLVLALKQLFNVILL